MGSSIRHALGNLANFSGRDARQTFWYWVLVVVILQFAVSAAMTVPMTMRMMSRFMAMGMQGSGSDPLVVQARLQAMMADMMATEMPRIVWVGIAVGVVSMLLLVASLVRRLHDSNLSGWWALAPGLMYCAALAMAPGQIEPTIKMMREMKPGVPPNMSAMMQMSLGQNLLAWVPVLLVIWFGVRKSTEGPNGYGDAPVAF
jgi:uncharacterized membrane protein YhaH (DUF805 family)